MKRKTRARTERRKEAWLFVALVVGSILFVWSIKVAAAKDSIDREPSEEYLMALDSAAEERAMDAWYSQIGAEWNEQDALENEHIEAALFDSGYFREDVPMDSDTQAVLHAAASEFGVPYELALAVIQRETGYRNVAGDGGDSIGYMQIQPQWCAGVMADIGAVDLWLAKDNFRTGCCILGGYYGAFGNWTDALARYNGSGQAARDYADAVTAIWEELNDSASK